MSQVRARADGLEGDPGSTDRLLGTGPELPELPVLGVGHGFAVAALVVNVERRLVQGHVERVRELDGQGLALQARAASCSKRRLARTRKEAMPGGASRFKIKPSGPSIQSERR